MGNNMLLEVNVYHSSRQLSYHSLKPSQMKIFKKRIRIGQKLRHILPAKKTWKADNQR